MTWFLIFGGAVLLLLLAVVSVVTSRHRQPRVPRHRMDSSPDWASSPVGVGDGRTGHSHHHGSSHGGGHDAGSGSDSGGGGDSGGGSSSGE